MIKVRYISYSLVAVLVLLMGVSYSHAAENLLKNGGFEDGVLAPWSIYNDAVKSEVIQKDAIEGKYCLHVTTVKSANFWDAGLQHDPGKHTFQKGKKYTLAAYLKSPNKLQINFKPELSADPWTGFGEMAFTMTESWAEYSTTTPVMASDVNPGAITFHIAYNAGEFYVDGVRFFEGDYVPPPAPTPSAVQPQAKLATAWGKIKAD